MLKRGLPSGHRLDQISTDLHRDDIRWLKSKTTATPEGWECSQSKHKIFECNKILFPQSIIHKITCIAIRLPIGWVNIPEKIQPNGTHNKFIEPDDEIKIFSFYSALDFLKLL